MDTTTIQVTLVVKGDADRAAQEVVARLNPWFLEDVNGQAPYEPGSLLYWRQTVLGLPTASHEQGAHAKESRT